VDGESGNEYCFVQNASDVRKCCSGGDDFNRLVDGVGTNRDCNAERQRQRFSVHIRYLVLSFKKREKQTATSAARSDGSAAPQGGSVTACRLLA
jgi:hypothetical protein